QFFSYFPVIEAALAGGGTTPPPPRIPIGWTLIDTLITFGQFVSQSGDLFDVIFTVGFQQLISIARTSGSSA
uniref:Uncharacterized protein n=1 Tax=Romanomermis culicivorax TaxID=13658 RepID=A0A915K4I2_ROMCU